jgi:ribonuclease HII
LGVGAASVAEIDALNVLEATMLAMRRALDRLRLVPALALVDGNRAPLLACPARAIVKGDGRSLSIAAASIVAKVTRDRLMARLARAHPGFGWERNAGYGTAEHRAALARHGPTPHHRRSFAPIRKVLNQQSY